MRVNSFVTRRVHLFLGASEQFVLEGVPRYQENDRNRLASIREIEILAIMVDRKTVFKVMARGQAINRNGYRGKVDRTFEFTGMKSLPEDIVKEVEAIFRRQDISTPNESYVISRENEMIKQRVMEVPS